MHFYFLYMYFVYRGTPVVQLQKNVMEGLGKKQKSPKAKATLNNNSKPKMCTKGIESDTDKMSQSQKMATPCQKCEGVRIRTLQKGKLRRIWRTKMKLKRVRKKIK